MFIHLPSWARTLVVCASVAPAIGCQTYDFEPITPFTYSQYTQRTVRAAKHLKPNMMLLVDQSTSMREALDPHCTGTCATRIDTLKSVMNAVLPAAGQVARLGLTIFPSKVDQCAPAGSATTVVPLPAPALTDEGSEATLAATTNQVIAGINAITPAGGTPTTASLNYLATLPGLLDDTDFRPDFVLLLTDGLPNCNPDNPFNVCADQSEAATRACHCLASGGNCAGPGLCAQGCLDSQRIVETVTALKKQHLTTIVVGFASELADPLATQVLEAMGVAGGFLRPCSQNADCGTGDSCGVDHQCTRHFFQAKDGAELANAVAKITGDLGQPPCSFPLDETPQDPALLSVLVDGVDVQRGPDSWSYDKGVITFGADTTWCRALTASTDATPINVEVRVLERL